MPVSSHKLYNNNTRQRVLLSLRTRVKKECYSQIYMRHYSIPPTSNGPLKAHLHLKTRVSKWPHGTKRMGQLTGNDINQLVGNGGLATTVVLHLERANHVRSVLRRVVHGIATRNLVRSISFVVID
jgi:hypothetical protein